MAAILNDLKHELELSFADDEMFPKSELAKRFILLTRLIEKAEKEKEKTLLELNEFEKQEAFGVLQRQDNIPEYITAHEAAEILEVSVQMVRRYCVEEKLNAFQRFPGSGKWLIETKQFMNHKNWQRFVQTREKIKHNSLKLANKQLEILGEGE